MYRIILATTLVSLIVYLIWRAQLEKVKLIKIVNKFFADIWHSVNELKNFSLKKNNYFDLLRQSFYGLVVVFFLVMAITGFAPILLFGDHPTGLLLIIHVTIAPFFVVALTTNIVLWAYSMRLNNNDYKYLIDILGNNKKRRDTDKIRFWKKISFWLFAIFSLPAILSMIMVMFPFFSTDTQLFFLTIHRYSTLVLFILYSHYIILKYTISNDSLQGDKS